MIRTNGHLPITVEHPPQPRPRATVKRMAAKAAMVLLIAAFAAGIVVFAVFNPGSTSGYNTTVEHFVLPRLDGPGTVSLDQLSGHSVVVSFFSSSCAQCATQLQAISELAAGQRTRVTYIAVDTKETGAGAAFAQRLGLTPAVVLASDVGGSDDDGLYEALAGTGTMPLTAFYSTGGTLLATHIGPMNSQDLDTRLLQLYGQGTVKP